jgi:hypothetical protein
MKFDLQAFNKSETWRLLQGNAGNWYQEASEPDRQKLQNWMYGMLNESTVQIEFTKADGSMRSMTCTLNETLGAKHVNKEPVNQSKTVDKKETCAVWDCNANGWRSFRWDRLQKIAVTIE